MNDTVITKTVHGDESRDLDVLLGAPALKHWYKRPAYIAALLSAVILLILALRFLGGEAKAGYATQVVRRDSLRVTVSATGNLAPTSQVEVGSEQSGLVDAVFADNNDRVIKSQPLARLDTSRLRDTLVQAQAALAAAEATVAQQQATLVQARSNLSRLEEVWRLSAGKVPSRQELDTGRAENSRAQAAIRAAQAQVASARAQLSSAQTNLAKATIYSPVTGVVLSRSVDPGQTVAASLSAPVLFTIAEDLGRMKLEVKVDEADVGEVNAGQRATFNVDAYPGRTFHAQVTRVDVGANASESSATASGSPASNVVAYTAVLAVENPDLVLRPGMTATAEIVTTEKKNVLLVPNAAFRFNPDASTQRQQNGGVTSVLVPRAPRSGGDGQQRQASIGRGSRQTVYVLDGDTARAVPVTIGESNGSLTEITAGNLVPGARVITGRLTGSLDSGGGGQSKTRTAAATLLPSAPAGTPREARRRRPRRSRHG